MQKKRSGHIRKAKTSGQR